MSAGAFLWRAFLTGGGLGLLPRAPGTFGTLGGVAIHALIAWRGVEWLALPLAGFFLP